jgi:hypothetical protein
LPIIICVVRQDFGEDDVETDRGKEIMFKVESYCDESKL